MGIRRDGREPDELRPITFTRDFTEFAAGSVLVEFGRTRVLCTASVEERIPAVAAGTGPGLGDRRVLDAPGLHLGAQRPRGGAREAVGPHAGDPAPHRAVAAGGHRPPHDGRGADHRRLRRAPGRRRHPHRVDLRRLRRAARRLLASGRRQEDGRASRHRPVRRDLGRHRRRARRTSISTTPRTCAPRST